MCVCVRWGFVAAATHTQSRSLLWRRQCASRKYPERRMNNKKKDKKKIQHTEWTTPAKLIYKYNICCKYGHERWTMNIMSVIAPIFLFRCYLHRLCFPSAATQKASAAEKKTQKFERKQRERERTKWMEKKSTNSFSVAADSESCADNTATLTYGDRTKMNICSQSSVCNMILFMFAGRLGSARLMH